MMGEVFDIVMKVLLGMLVTHVRIPGLEAQLCLFERWNYRWSGRDRETKRDFSIAGSLPKQLQ